MQKRISTFLKFGHFINVVPRYNLPYDTIDKSKYKDYSQEELMNLGEKILIDSVCSMYQSNKHNLVPISGGLDSRAILSCLLRCCNASHITTYTFGVPGALDYEIGNRIAKKLGTKHISTDFNKFVYTKSYLCDIAKNTNYQGALFNNPPLDILRENTDSTSVIWSGFMGGEIAGSHYLSDIRTHEQAKKKYVSKFAYHQVSFPGSQDANFYERLSLDKEYSNMSLFDQYDFQIRQSKNIAPSIMLDEFNYMLPFVQKDVFSFFMSIPNEYRINRNLYKQVLLQMDKELFSMGTKETGGIDSNASKFAVLTNKANLAIKYVRYKSKSSYRRVMNANYINYREAIREKPDYNQVIYQSIMQLDKRDILEKGFINKTYKDHMNKAADNSYLLILLASLEIIMQCTPMEQYIY